LLVEPKLLTKIRRIVYKAFKAFENKAIDVITLNEYIRQRMKRHNLKCEVTYMMDKNNVVLSDVKEDKYVTVLHGDLVSTVYCVIEDKYLIAFTVPIFGTLVVLGENHGKKETIAITYLRKVGRTKPIATLKVVPTKSKTNNSVM